MATKDERPHQSQTSDDPMIVSRPFLRCPAYPSLWSPTSYDFTHANIPLDSVLDLLLVLGPFMSQIRKNRNVHSAPATVYAGERRIDFADYLVDIEEITELLEWHSNWDIPDIIKSDECVEFKVLLWGEEVVRLREVRSIPWEDDWKVGNYGCRNNVCLGNGLGYGRGYCLTYLPNSFVEEGKISRALKLRDANEMLAQLSGCEQIETVYVREGKALQTYDELVNKVETMCQLKLIPQRGNGILLSDRYRNQTFNYFRSSCPPDMGCCRDSSLRNVRGAEDLRRSCSADSLAPTPTGSLKRIPSDVNDDVIRDWYGIDKRMAATRSCVWRTPSISAENSISLRNLQHEGDPVTAVTATQEETRDRGPNGSENGVSRGFLEGQGGKEHLQRISTTSATIPLNSNPNFYWGILPPPPSRSPSPHPAPHLPGNSQDPSLVSLVFMALPRSPIGSRASDEAIVTASGETLCEGPHQFPVTQPFDSLPNPVHYSSEGEGGSPPTRLGGESLPEAIQDDAQGEGYYPVDDPGYTNFNESFLSPRRGTTPPGRVHDQGNYTENGHDENNLPTPSLLLRGYNRSSTEEMAVTPKGTTTQNRASNPGTPSAREILRSYDPRGLMDLSLNSSNPNNQAQEQRQTSASNPGNGLFNGRRRASASEAIVTTGWNGYADFEEAQQESLGSWGSLPDGVMPRGRRGSLLGWLFGG